MGRLAVLISGNGSNLQALIDRSTDGTIDAEIAVVVSSRRDAYGLERATRAGIPTETVRLAEFSDSGRSAFDRAVADVVDRYEPDLIVLAGWMLVLGEEFLGRFPGKVINLHPALPGAFPGTDAIARAHAAFGRGEIEHTGVMVHGVVAEVDAGPVIVSEPVPILHGDSVEELEERVHRVEHRLIVAAVDLALRGDA
jgi:formyltetrahydrofolate-dependent phosphoribosylglycinamide formyltransferase